MKQILCFGDSNTWGYNPENGERYGWGIRWTSILQEQLKDKNIRIIEEGLCGRTTVFEDELREGRRGISQLPYILESHAPIDIIILMLGTNDCKTIYKSNETIIGKGIKSLLDVIKKIQPEAKVLLVSPIHLGDSVWKKEFDPEFDENSVIISHKLKDEYSEIAKERHLEFMAASDYASFSEADMEHMNEQNHRRFAEAVYDKIVSLF